MLVLFWESYRLKFPLPKYTNNSMMSSQILVMRVSCTLLTDDHALLTAGLVRIVEWLD